MKMLKILHYVEESFGDKPSFVILMSDQKEYISNGCVWVENTEKNIQDLIDGYDCEQYLDELFLSESIDMNDVVDARFMFWNSNITEFDSNMSSVVDARYMFYKSNLTTFSSNMSNVEYTDSMFTNTNLKIFSSNMSNVTDTRYMFYGSNITEFDTNMSSVKYTRFMFANTNLKKFSSNMSNIIDNYNMFDNTPYNSNK